jgi:hypothetical protein
MTMEYISDIKCGDVLLSMGPTEHFLDALENLYKKRITYEQYAPHTYAVFLTKLDVSQSFGVSRRFYLLWKSFFGVRWMNSTYATSSYIRLKTLAGAIVNLNLGLEELEVEQDHFNKWRGNEITEKLKSHVLREDITEKIQRRIEEIASGLLENKYEPDGEPELKGPDWVSFSDRRSKAIWSQALTCPHCKARYVYKDADKESGSVACNNCTKTFEVALESTSPRLTSDDRECTLVSLHILWRPNREEEYILVSFD